MVIDLDTETVEIDHAARAAEKSPGLVQRFSLSGFPINAKFKVNGENQLVIATVLIASLYPQRLPRSRRSVRRSCGALSSLRGDGHGGIAEFLRLVNPTLCVNDKIICNPQGSDASS